MKIAALALACLMPLSVSAQDQECREQAYSRLQKFLGSSKVADNFLQASHVLSVGIQEFKNLTPGTYFQQYVGIFILDYVKSEKTLYETQKIKVSFESAFACEDLKIKGIAVIGRRLSEFGRQSGRRDLGKP